MKIEAAIKLGELVLNCVIASAAIVGGVYAYKSFTASQRQATAAERTLTEMQDEQRPWLKVSLKTSALHWARYQDLHSGKERWFGSMDPTLSVENVGNSPALQAQAMPWPFLIQGAFTTADIQRTTCLSKLQDTVGGLRAFIVFPHDKAITTAAGFGSMGFDIGEADKPSAAGFPIGTQQVALYIAGCADYRSSTSSIHHRTFFAYQAAHVVSRNNGLVGYDVSFKVGQDVPAEDMLLEPVEIANNAE